MIQTSSDAQASSANPVVPVGRGAHPRRRGALVVALTVAALAVVVRPTGMAATTARDLSPTVRADVPRAASFPGLDTLRGVSRKLRARFLAPHRAASIPVLRQLFGDSAATRPGVYAANDSTGAFHFITMRPFADKVRGRIGAYRIGFFPAEKRARGGSYGNPEGFLEVTAGNADTPISEHFRLRDFLTKDQTGVWPKYLVLREPLVDKLELVLQELRTMGVHAATLRVMSGFRTPQYNQQGVGTGGRANDSRHQYGDAADVYVVNGARDWMSDLNADGRVDTHDARVLAQAAERVERAHPELVGGIGVYKATSAHGPFVHIDVRGSRARWGAQ
ncbi:D-Ala-D-Ala carboxypeptidase family metallohydrolase [Gemmatimonas sp.]|uniref:D-Ala-D-Ala carboxypeptidase family metallohydrolase n=1 Tax=Gemmatimonas sp. TaxID=1962908 RepID=UPI0022CC4C77|nr:D-Ala-D-Ala carboxypeptidase family metallohydrolase [Gemmatimonas sp.]MCA2985576.1 hypothetical protein [Gemmatimonas sp.]MCA2987761.1 hypothetical protein [Gemmatimonas sp.]MCA2990171.1 hypothetical protein [Gemmatimonas sp.]MCA2995327.1 hypothetical protein [Gemmatimonas sp.]MCE2953124.1 D-Ala-D-Ala carboxypeptidase family metallohydrolase [Gemmatimonas sp.]